jgi:spermidine/putrescine transport system ATP-binding protein
MTTAISIQSVTKQFQDFQALDEISFDIKEGEFFTLLGPSGCGKTTLLRLLGGFEQTTSGTIKLFDQEIENLPANKRPINTVFQHYSLFPHLTIHENIQFGLKMQGMCKLDRIKRADEMLELVQLSDFSDRKPNQLSGGQQQRVALARALAPKPKLLLLDEPLSALDLKLRQSMRLELKKIQKQTGITFVFVTHDQEEALTMSDRIAVMSAGHLQQLGTPSEIYEEPANEFVANFIGETNLLDVEIINKNSEFVTVSVQATNSSFKNSPPFEVSNNSSIFLGPTAKLSIRPERISLISNSSDEKFHLSGTVSESIYMGTDTQYIVQLDNGEELLTRNQNITNSELSFKAGDKVKVRFDLSTARLLRRMK